MPGGLQGLRQDDVVEGVVRIVAEIRVGVALDHSQPLRHAFVHALPREFDTASVDTAAFAQKLEQFPVTATDVENLCAALDHLGNKNQVDTRTAGGAGGAVCAQIDIGA